MSGKVAVVTGANKGIGLALVRALCQQKPNWKVYLCARDVQRGRRAVDGLASDGFKVEFCQLDVTRQDHVDGLADLLKKKHGGVDVVINNAGIIRGSNCDDPLEVQARQIIDINYMGLLRCSNALIPLLKAHGRVVQMSSRNAALCYHQLPAELQHRALNQCKTVDEVTGLMEEYVASFGGDDEKWAKCRTGTVDAYGVSKLGVNLLTFAQQAVIDQSADAVEKDLAINAATPGYVNTDMTNGMGVLTVEEGAVTPVYLATLADGSPVRGKFVGDCKVIEAWFDDVPARFVAGDK